MTLFITFSYICIYVDTYEGIHFKMELRFTGTKGNKIKVCIGTRDSSGNLEAKEQRVKHLVARWLVIGRVMVPQNVGPISYSRQTR